MLKRVLIPSIIAIISGFISTANASVGKSISGSMSLARSNSLYTINGNTAVSSWDYSGLLSYSFSPNLSSALLIEGSQDLKTPEDSDLSKGQVKTSYLLSHSSKALFLYTPSVTFGFPVSRLQNSSSFKGSAGLGMKISMNPDRLISKKLSVDLSVSGARNFHQYETKVSGEMNNQYGSTQALIVGWSFFEGLDFSVEADHINTWSYRGTLSEYYAHAEELAYQAGKSFNFAVGHQYGNPYLSVWKANGESYNFKATDEDNSIIYAKVAILF